MEIKEIAELMKFAAVGDNFNPIDLLKQGQLGLTDQHMRVEQVGDFEIKFGFTRTKVEDKVFWLLSFSNNKDEVPITDDLVNKIVNAFFDGRDGVLEMPSVLRPGLTKKFIKFENYDSD